MYKVLGPASALLLIVGGVALAFQGTAALVLGIILALLGAFLLSGLIFVMRDPAAAAQKLLARRQELEHQISGNSEVAPGSVADVTEPASAEPLNRAARRAQARKKS